MIASVLAVIECNGWSPADRSTFKPIMPPSRVNFWTTNCRNTVEGFGAGKDYYYSVYKDSAVHTEVDPWIYLNVPSTAQHSFNIAYINGENDQGYGRGGTPIFSGVFEPLARVSLYPTDVMV